MRRGSPGHRSGRKCHFIQFKGRPDRMGVVEGVQDFRSTGLPVVASTARPHLPPQALSPTWESRVTMEKMLDRVMKEVANLPKGFRHKIKGAEARMVAEALTAGSSSSPRWPSGSCARRSPSRPTRWSTSRRCTPSTRRSTRKSRWRSIRTTWCWPGRRTTTGRRLPPPQSRRVRWRTGARWRTSLWPTPGSACAWARRSARPHGQRDEDLIR
ncbi:hypothetical protein DFJ74DRAFT_767387, partial [Hyaloraphidium curvatum]